MLQPRGEPAPTHLDTEIGNGIRELERLAVFYTQRGNAKQAEEIRQAIHTIRNQIAARATEGEQAQNI
jgi:hypothetical protein